MSRVRDLFRTLVATAVVGLLSPAVAQDTLYWDINGATPGAGNVGGFTDGFWGVDDFWSSDPAGEEATGAWVEGANAVFSAGDDAVDHFIDVDGTQVANSMTVEDGVVFIASGVVDRGDGDVVIEDGATLRIESTLRLNNGGRVLLRNGTLWQSNPGFAGSFVGSNTVIEVDGTGTIDRTALNVDNTEPAEPPERRINIFTALNGGTIAGTGGTPENGGAGTLIKTGPDEFRYQGTGLATTSFAKLVVEEGLYRLGFNANTQDERGFGAVPLDVLPDAITLNGGSIATSFFPPENAELHPNRGITIGPNGGRFASGHLRVPGPLSGSGTLTIETGNATARLANANNVNTFSGNVVIGSGILDLDESLSTPNFSGTYTGDADPPVHGVAIAEDRSLTVGSDNADATFTGNVDGPGDFVKVGTGTQTLSGAANESSANLVVQEGTLSLTEQILTETANVSIDTGALLDLDFSGTMSIASLFIDDESLDIGTWGATGSGADNETDLITGAGLLGVTVLDTGVLVGDYNNDGMVDAADYTVWRDSLGGDTLQNRDPENEGVIGDADYASWVANFGATSGNASLSATGAVPEPSAVVLAALAMLGLAACRRR